MIARCVSEMSWTHRRRRYGCVPTCRGTGRKWPCASAQSMRRTSLIGRRSRVCAQATGYLGIAASLWTTWTMALAWGPPMTRRVWAAAGVRPRGLKRTPACLFFGATVDRAGRGRCCPPPGDDIGAPWRESWRARARHGRTSMPNCPRQAVGGCPTTYRISRRWACIANSAVATMNRASTASRSRAAVR